MTDPPDLPVLPDLPEMYERFSSLRAFVAGESRLAAFLPAAVELQRQAALILQGERSIPLFSDEGNIPIGRNVPRIADEPLAKALLGAIERLPAIDLDGDPPLALAYATLLGNVTVSMMRAIFGQYPHIVPRTPTQT